MNYTIPEQPENSFRITLELESKEDRLDTILLEALRAQSENNDLNQISKLHLKRLFTDKKILIKGQNAKAKSSVNSGTTYVDILLG